MALTAEDKQDIRGIVTDVVGKATVGLATEKFVTTKIDELALSVKHGFDAVDKRFDAVDERFKQVDKHFDKLDLDMTEVKFRLTDVVHRDEFLGLKQRVDKLEAN